MKKRLSNGWIEFKEIFHERFGVEPILADYIACWDILILTAGGRANKTISNFILEDDLSYIKKVQEEFLDFDGYKYDLDINTLMIYNRVDGDKDRYLKELEEITPLLFENKELVETSYEVCKKFKEIERKVNEFYANC